MYGEVVETGISEGHPDARRIQRATEEGLFVRESVSDEGMFSQLSQNSKLSEADVALFTITKELNGIAVIDERYGRAVAKAEGIPTRSTAFLVINAIREGTMLKEGGLDQQSMQWSMQVGLSHHPYTGKLLEKLKKSHDQSFR